VGREGHPIEGVVVVMNQVCTSIVVTLPALIDVWVLLFAGVNWMPHPWRFHGWAAMPMGSGDFADVKLCFSGLINQNWAAFAVGVMAEAAPQPLLGLQN